MAETAVHTIDLNFQGMRNAIASYLICSGDAVVLVESGPGSTQSALEKSLHSQGLRANDVTHVLLTHIHLDHAGAAGWLAQHGAQIYVHSVGAPHMLHPEKLIASAKRIYGDQMDTLWGEFLAVPQDKLTIPNDREEIAIGALRFLPLNTPGHAEHHFVYVLDDLCFSGDIGGIRIQGQPVHDLPYLRVPMPPPELHIEKWKQSIKIMQSVKFKRIAPTHFGIFGDADAHLRSLEAELIKTEKWIESVLPSDPPIEQLRELLSTWMTDQARSAGVSEETLQSYSLANPVGMSADGIQRYWKKIRKAL